MHFTTRFMQNARFVPGSRPPSAHEPPRFGRACRKGVTFSRDDGAPYKPAPQHPPRSAYSVRLQARRRTRKDHAHVSSFKVKTAVQQIMLGTVTGTAERAREALRRIRDAGYDGLELNRYMIHPTPAVVRLLTRAAGMPAGNGGRLDWRGLVGESGLSVVSLHTDLGTLERDPAAIAEEARDLGTGRVVITGMYRFEYGSEQAVRDLAGRLDRAGERLRDAGVELLYHNHNAELAQVRPGVRAYDLLISETDPALVGFEFDSFWFAAAGADPAAWMRRLGRRMRLWHVTDRGFRLSGPAMTPILKADSVELGRGAMDLDALREVAVGNGVEAVVLESHRNWVDKDPLKSLELSAEWLRERF